MGNHLRSLLPLTESIYLREIILPYHTNKTASGKSKRALVENRQQKFFWWLLKELNWKGVLNYEKFVPPRAIILTKDKSCTNQNFQIINQSVFKSKSIDKTKFSTSYCLNRKPSCIVTSSNDKKESFPGEVLGRNPSLGSWNDTILI